MKVTKNYILLLVILSVIYSIRAAPNPNEYGDGKVHAGDILFQYGDIPTPFLIEPNIVGKESNAGPFFTILMNAGDQKIKRNVIHHS